MKRLKLFLILFVAVNGFIVLISQDKASAVSGDCFFTTNTGPVNNGGGTCSVPGNGAYGTNDVLRGRSTNGSGKAIPNSINTKTEFISFINGRYNGSYDQDQVGAAFIVQEMRGNSRAWPSQTQVNDWIELMRQDGVTFQRTWDSSVGRTSYFDTNRDNTFYGSHPTVGREVIYIRQNGNLVAEIEVLCGNMVANSSPIVRKWNLTPASSVTPYAAPSELVTFNHSITNPTQYANMNQNLTGTVQWTVRGADNTVVTINTACSKTGGLISGQTQSCSNAFTIPATATNGQRYCQRVVASPNTESGGTQGSTSACVTVNTGPGPEVGKKPYFQVLNGDISASTAVRDTNGNCTGQGGSIDAFYNNPSGIGSSTQIAALANGLIDGFISAKGRVPSMSIIGLTFANVDAGAFGGSYGITSCVSNDDWENLGTGNITVTQTSPSIVETTGDVYITTDLIYGNGSFSLSAVPTRKIVTNGDIYIGSNVRQIDGVLKAKGTIYTCAVPGPASGTLVKPSSLQAATLCKDNKLSVQGALIANSIKLLRTIGDADDGSNPNNPAETFTYSPEVWIRGLGGGTTTRSTKAFDAYRSLPPTL